jgi:hypothetical protein
VLTNFGSHGSALFLYLSTFDGGALWDDLQNCARTKNTIIRHDISMIKGKEILLK